MQLTDLTMLELAAKLAARTVSSEEATRACLERIRQVDPKVRAFLRVDEEGALAAAAP
ncbi:Asp-tRNA(Asn)/Glu-tRNA(Gln) amidotransferase GatCAB subunit A, partial [Pyxidicoccus sp. 3LG]